MNSVSVFRFWNRMYKPRKPSSAPGLALSKQMKEMTRVIHSKQLFDDKDLIDICCEGGEYAAFFATLGASSVVALDPDAAYGKAVNARFLSQNKDPSAKFRFVDSPPESLPYPDNHFDTAFLTEALTGVQDPATVLAEAVRVIRPGGFVCIRQTVWDSPHGGGISEFCRIPYGHLLFSEKTLIAALRDPKMPDNERLCHAMIHTDDRNIPHLNARQNRLTAKKLKQLFRESAGKTVDFRYLPIGKAFRVFSGLPLLHTGVLCILQKPVPAEAAEKSVREP